jgi:hypothetical protein
MAERIEPFIHSTDRLDLLADLARTHSERTFKAIASLIERNITIDPNHKKDGKDGGKDAGEGGFWDKKDGKDGKDKEKDGSKITGTEGELFRYGLEVSLPADALRRIVEIHNVRLTALLNQPIF